MITRLAIDESRRAYRRSELSASKLPDHPVAADSDSAIGLDVRAALQRLAPKHRAVLVLRFYWTCRSPTLRPRWVSAKERSNRKLHAA